MFGCSVNDKYLERVNTTFKLSVDYIIFPNAIIKHESIRPTAEQDVKIFSLMDIHGFSHREMINKYFVHCGNWSSFSINEEMQCHN